MKATRRAFLGTSAAAAAAGVEGSGRMDAVEAARRQRITKSGLSPDFFEGMLLGNGDIGVCVVTRPDALGLHIGKNDSWDIRVSEEHAAHIKTFQEVLELWKRAGEEARKMGQPEMTYLESKIPFFKQYSDLMQSSYRKPWPRPWPCGTIWVHWDSRMVRVLSQTLDIASGLLTISLEHDDLRGAKSRFALSCFVSRDNGHISLSSAGPAPVLSVAYHPHGELEAKLPPPRMWCEGAQFGASQYFPATAPTDAQPDPPATKDDRNFALHAVLAGNWKAVEPDARRRRIFLEATQAQPFRLDVALFTTLDVNDNAAHARREAMRLAALPAAQLQERSAGAWAEFWKKSAVEFKDADLQRIWYRNQYFLACCLKPGKVAPGLFGNWTSGKIGTAWHGDYHMNYNTQQVWWGVFSSNHVEQHEPYTRLIENLMPMAEWNARVQFGMPGAYFPHTAYPVPSNVNPYPAPPWGYEICETPWAVQSLWWQYRYTLDKEYLRRVYPMMRAAADFLMAFVTREADGKYHIVPTVSPENWGATVDYRLNKDCIIDLALTEFLLDAMQEASQVLDVDASLRPDWKRVRDNLAPYPSGRGPFGDVWLDVLNAPHEWVYNVPVTLSPVFPCEQVGIGLRPAMREIAERTIRTVRLEGGNDLVWQPMARARMGMLDLAWFRREVDYCTLPAGFANDRVRQVGGRYRDETNFDFMMRMGVWTENLSLPAVLNECLMQSYSGVIRLFPNTTGMGPARFQNLRAAGAFLVSAAWDGKTVSGVSLTSEKGAGARIASPWGKARVELRLEKAARVVPLKVTGEILEFSTVAGETYSLRPL